MNATTAFKQQMQGIMNLAWQFVKRNGYSMSEALTVAWQNFKLRREMATRIVKFYYLKVSGEPREAFGTLRTDLLPPTGDGRKPNPTVQVYYDTEREAYRSFKKANLLSIAH